MFAVASAELVPRHGRWCCRWCRWWWRHGGNGRQCSLSWRRRFSRGGHFPCGRWGERRHDCVEFGGWCNPTWFPLSRAPTALAERGVLVLRRAAPPTPASSYGAARKETCLSVGCG